MSIRQDESPSTLRSSSKPCPLVRQKRVAKSYTGVILANLAKAIELFYTDWPQRLSDLSSMKEFRNINILRGMLHNSIN